MHAELRIQHSAKIPVSPGNTLQAREERFATVNDAATLQLGVFHPRHLLGLLHYGRQLAVIANENEFINQWAITPVLTISAKERQHMD